MMLVMPVNISAIIGITTRPNGECMWTVKFAELLERIVQILLLGLFFD